MHSFTLRYHTLPWTGREPRKPVTAVTGKKVSAGATVSLCAPTVLIIATAATQAHRGSAT